MSQETITSEKRFILYYDRLRDEINHAYTHHEISKTLNEFRRTHRSEFSVAITFLQLTIYAHLYEAIMTICRFIDKPSKSLHLDNFFKFINNNLSLFSSESYKARLAAKGHDEEYCEDFVRRHQDITTDMVQEDKVKIESLPINNLKIWRDKKLAHIERELVLKETDIAKQYPIKIQDIDDILSTLHDILNKYRGAFDGVEWVLGLPSTKHQIAYIFNAISQYTQARK